MFKIIKFVLIIVLSENLISCNTNKIDIENFSGIELNDNNIGKTNYYILLPKGWYVSEDVGPDFIVYYICSEVDDSEEEITFGGLYFGNHPSKFTEDYGKQYSSDNYVYSKILGKYKKWEIFKIDDYYFTEVIMRNPGSGLWNRKVHIWANGNTQEELQKMIYIYSLIKKK